MSKLPARIVIDIECDETSQMTELVDLITRITRHVVPTIVDISGDFVIPPAVETQNVSFGKGKAIHKISALGDRALCGAGVNSPPVSRWEQVTCTRCKSALRAL